MTQQFDIAIIGAGIVGAACAAALARDGHHIVVVERDSIGGGATAAGMGHVVVMDDSPAQLILTSYSRQLWHELVQSLPASAETQQCGTMWVAADDEEMAAVQVKRELLAQVDVESVVLGASGLRQMEPELREGLSGGLRVPHDLVVYPPVVARFLLCRAQEQGVQVRTHCRVLHLDSDGTIDLADGTRLVAQCVVVATGCWASELCPDLPVKSRKGHLVITDRYPGFVHHQLIELGYLKSAHAMQKESVAFNIQPRQTGQMLIGSSRQFDADDDDVDLEMVSRMMRRAEQFLPRLGRLTTLRTWTGHRAATPDKLPLIGPSRTSDRIWCATGHEGLGIATSLGTAELLADQVAGREPRIPATPYLPHRYTKSEGHHA